MESKNKIQLQQEALTRATSGQSWGNYQSIFEGFIARGIPETDIKPRENVFTYNAWLAQGRQVRRGEHGVKITTFVEIKPKDGDDGDASKTYKRPQTTTVFHVSQTSPK